MRRPSRARRSLEVVRPGDLLGVAWVLISGIAILVPAFIHGNILGPFYLLAQDGLTKHPGVGVPNIQNSDLANSLIPWWTIAWQQVHQGHLPIWNPYGGLGIPLAFNWQSAPFSLPALVGYLAPVRYAFTVGVMVDMAVAGLGAYVLGRVLGMGVVASAAVGTVFELSGPIAAWLGYPFPSVMSWGGWIFAFGLLIMRGRHRAGCIVGLAVCTALSIYGGAPEGFALLALTAAVFFAVVLACRTRWLGGSGPIIRPTIDLAVAMVAGSALAAPFALPGLELATRSVRSLSTGRAILAPHALTYLAFQGFDGLPISPFFRNGEFTFFGASIWYTETAAYVGAAALVLAITGVVVCHRRPEVRGFAVVCALCLALVFVPLVNGLAGSLPLLRSVNLVRSLMPLALAIAVLAGVGIELVVRAPAARAARRLGIGFGVAAFALLGLWIFGRGHLGPTDTTIRAHSFIWPAVETAVGLVSAGFLFWVARRPRRSPAGPSGPVETDGVPNSGAQHQSGLRWPGTIAAFGLLAVQTAFLVSAGAQMLQSSPHFFPQTSTTNAFSAAVGSATVGSGVPGCSLGLQPNINGVYGVHELDVYDPIIPKSYFTVWPAVTGTSAGVPSYNLFCPAVTSVAEAREFGVGYVLEKAGIRGPLGSVFVRHLGDEDLYRIPGAGQATVAPLSDGSFPSDSLAGTPITVRHAGPSEWRLVTSSGSPQALRLHLTDVPGWHATIDGRPLALESYAGMMLQARVPAGVHTIALRYWPNTFTGGIIMALVSATFLIGLLVASSQRRRKRSANGKDNRSESVAVAP